MQDSKRHILFTRTISESLIAEAKANGIIITAIPFIKTVALPQAEIKDAAEEVNADSIVVFTSANTVDAIAGINANLGCKVYCISGATLQAVQQKLSSCKIIAVADNARELAAKMLEDKTVESATFFCGDHYLPELPQTLQAAGISVNVRVVYKTELAPHFVKDEYDAIVFFSPTAVKSFFSVNTISANRILFAIGNTTAHSLSGFKSKILISSLPDANAMVETIIDFYKTGVPG
jgi:uroporphyrinogen-III synthase